ncbi:hypothetical protein SAMD00023353_1801650 [Rosellinia necatrix]|uniref:Uncharacterized protein n=1 Tax=Rosellinia necatrix TaxID=77044 RepID=A0A1S8A7J1_ROSNE|nr:hypothetical protein SAMD00023353_1801650 [Rosellinia necatrix]
MEAVMEAEGRDGDTTYGNAALRRESLERRGRAIKLTETTDTEHDQTGDGGQ